MSGIVDTSAARRHQRSPERAQRWTTCSPIFEDYEGYSRGDAHAERVMRLPDELQQEHGWKDGPQGRLWKDAGWPSDALLVSCGGEVAPQPRDHLRKIMGIVSKDVRFGDRVFRSGDHVENLDRTRGIKTARLSVFPNGRNK